MRNLLCFCSLTLLIAPAWGAKEPPLPAEAKAEAALLQAAGPRCRLKKTDSFLIAYDTKTDLINQLSQRAEYTFRAIYRFCADNKIAVDRPRRRLEIILFNEPRDYYRFGQKIDVPAEGTFGLYHYNSNRSMFFNAANHPEIRQLQQGIAAAQADLSELQRQMRTIPGPYTPVEILFPDGRRLTLNKMQVAQEIDVTRDQLKMLDRKGKSFSTRINRTVIQHEIAHQVLFNAGVHVHKDRDPKWIVEGLATLFETPPGHQGIGIKAINYMRLQDFRSAVAGEESDRPLSGRDYLAAVRAERIPDLETLVSDSDIFATRGEAGSNVYAATWALTHYLQRKQSAKLAAYLQALRARPSEAEIAPAEELALFEKHFGPINQAFIEAFCRYIFKIKPLDPDA